MHALSQKSTIDLGESDIQRLRALLRGHIEEQFKTPKGRVRLLDGASSAVAGKIKLGESLFILEFHPLEGDSKKRMEIFAFNSRGTLILYTATEWGSYKRGGLDHTGRIQASTPYATSGLEIVKLLSETNRED